MGRVFGLSVARFTTLIDSRVQMGSFRFLCSENGVDAKFVFVLGEGHLAKRLFVEEGRPWSAFFYLPGVDRPIKSMLMRFTKPL